VPERSYASQLSPSCVLVAEAAAAGDAVSSNGARELDSRRLGDVRLALQATDGRRELDDIGVLVRRVLAPLDAGGRTEALAFLACSLEHVPEGERFAVSEQLFGLREALRERLPATVVSQANQRGIVIDRLMSVDERSFYLEGWLHDPEITRLTAVSPEGSRAELLGRLSRHPRPDVGEFFSLGSDKFDVEPGFICFFELDAPSLRSEGWILELENQRGIVSELPAPDVQSDVQEVKDGIMNDPYIAGLPDDELMADHVFPAISRIQERIGTEAKIDTVTQFGSPPESPDVSIVVPLYLQIQHLEVQLAQFADDPDIAQADLIFVLDSPKQKEELLNYAADLYPIYLIPFRVAVLERNVGFAGANNAGVELARGRLLLLLNSDVLPESPGWLTRMREFYDATDRIGALGPKLLYEDDSIQHAGMYFHQLPGSDKWVDGHYYKGMHRSLPAANVARPVPVVSGSCLMIERALYDKVGGLSGVYVQGDYEDSDLCLQLWREGRQNWYLPDAELYHLEGQSYSEDIRRPANRYNMWLHNRMWAQQVSELMEQDFAGDTAAT
jgi:O-antigen biosynthesis protein